MSFCGIIASAAYFFSGVNVFSSVIFVTRVGRARNYFVFTIPFYFICMCLRVLIIIIIIKSR